MLTVPFVTMFIVVMCSTLTAFGIDMISRKWVGRVFHKSKVLFICYLCSFE
jgi:hypothetical protein